MASPHLDVTMHSPPIPHVFTGLVAGDIDVAEGLSPGSRTVGELFPDRVPSS